jgi:hypothetical protein
LSHSWTGISTFNGTGVATSIQAGSISIVASFKAHNNSITTNSFLKSVKRIGEIQTPEIA